MPKVSEDFNPATYAPVADRLTLFWSAHPAGRIETDLIDRSHGEVVFRARVYRDASESVPAATGWAAEREGDGHVNAVACLENTETSAIGRALANLGFTASRQRPSAEEMQKVARGRERVGRPQSRRASEALQGRANLVSDLLRLIGDAERVGLRKARAIEWRRQLLADRFPDAALATFDRRLRDWVRRRMLRVGTARDVQT